MYGRQRVVLSSKTVTTSGKKIVSVTGGRSHHPIGFWYEIDGKFYADLKSSDQWYQAVNSETIANKGRGGVPTKQALRKMVQDYYQLERGGSWA